MNWRHETWRKLYVREEGTFGTLSLMARGLAAELLKICDDTGEIRLGGKSLAEAVSYRLGATRSDRRLLPGLIAELLADGYLAERSGVVAIKNFSRAQSRKAAANEPPSSRDGAANEPPSSRDGAANEPPSSRDGAANEPPSSREESSNQGKPFNTASVVPFRSESFRAEKLRAEKKRSDTDSSELAADGPASEPPAIAIIPPVLTFPCIGKGAKSWDLTEAAVKNWQELYPPLDILAEARKALAWIETNQRKTAKGMPRFMVGWLNSATNGGRGAGAGGGQGRLWQRPPRDVRVGHARVDDSKHTLTGELEI